MAEHLNNLLITKLRNILEAGSLAIFRDTVACDNGQCPINAVLSQAFGKLKYTIVKTNQRFTFKHHYEIPLHKENILSQSCASAKAQCVCSHEMDFHQYIYFLKYMILN